MKNYKHFQATKHYVLKSFKYFCIKQQNEKNLFISVFKTIGQEDLSFFEGDIRDFSYPDFGKSDSPMEVWQEFYSFFSAYVTTRFEDKN